MHLLFLYSLSSQFLIILQYLYALAFSLVGIVNYMLVVLVLYLLLVLDLMHVCFTMYSSACSHRVGCDSRKMKAYPTYVPISF